MKQANLFPLSFRSTGIAIVLLAVSLCSNAQVTQLTDYVMFSGNGGAGTTNPGTAGYGTIFGSGVTIIGGSIGSYRLVQTTGGSDLTTNIYSGGKVTLANGNHVSGRITAENLYPAPVSGTVISAGSNAILSGVMDANGNVTVQSGTVTGPVHTTGTYTGPAPTNGVSNAVSFPTLPVYPDAIVFPAAGATNITNTQTISPGNYGAINFANNKTLTFNGPGVYVFSSINLSGNNNFIYNFNNTTTGCFKIYVHGDAMLGKINASAINGGSATRIYMEVHGNGASSSSGTESFTIANGSGGNGTVKFYGTVNCVNAALLIGSGSGSSSFTGALFSRTRVQVQTGVTLTWSFFSECTPPTANAGSDATFCSGGTASLGSSPVSGMTYSWSPTTGLSNPNISNPTVTLSAPGTTIYTLTVSSSSSCSNIDQVLVTVNALPTVTANAVSGCAGTSIALSGSPAGGTWSVANPYTGPGTTYTHTYTDANGCSNTSAPATITVNPLPTVTANAVSGCAGTSIALSGTPSGGTWSVANPYTGPSTTYTHSYTDANGCSNTSAAATITVNPLPAVTGANASFCAGSSVTLAGSPAGGTWSVPNPYSGASTTYTYSYTNPSTGCSNTSIAYTITRNALPTVTANAVNGCTGASIALSGTPAGGTWSVANPYTGPSTTYTHSYTDANGCSNTSAPATITINPLPTVTADAVSGCTGSSIALSGTPTGGTWSVANPYTGPATTYTHSFTDANGCSNTSAPATITVNPLPTVTADAVSGCTGTSIALSGTPAGGTWSVANPYTGSSTTYTHSFTDANGCSNTSAPASITVNPLPAVTAANASFCEGSSVTLPGSPAGGTWSVANPYSGASTTYTYSYTNPSTGCSNTSIAYNITRNALPVVTANAVSGCTGASIALSGSPAGGTWSVANPYTGPSTTYTHSFTDANGCSNTSASATITVNPLPAVTADAVSGCAGSSIALSGSPAGGTWSVANPYTGASTTYTHSFTDANGCSNTSSPASITVNPLPNVTAGDVSGCEGSSIALSGTPAGGTWSVANPYTGSTTTYTHSFTDANGCSNTSAPANITVNPLPIVTADNVSGCTGSSIALSGSPAGGTWSVANPYTGSSTTYTHTFSTSHGCSATSAPASITVNPLPEVSINSYSPVCVGASSFSLSGSPAGGTFSGPGVSGGSFNPATAGVGTHTITYSFTDANLCSASASTSIQVTALPSVSINSVGSLCTNGADVVLTGNPSGGTFSGPNVTANTFSPSTAGIGTFTVTYVYNNGSCSNSASANLTVNGLPDVHAGNGYQMNCNDTIIQLHGSSSTLNALYHWSGTNGGHFSANQNSANPSIDGHGSFTLTVTDPSTNCSAYDTVSVPFDPCIFPGYTPPVQGKSGNLIGSELTQLYYWFLANGCTNPNEDIFIIIPCQVLVEIVYNEGERQGVYDIITSSPFNVTDTVDNGGRNRIMTCFVPVAELMDLNNLNVTYGHNYINHVRPVYRPIPTTSSTDSTGVAYSLGDVAQRSDIARKGFHVDGTGVKVGVISNSYNTQPGNKAALDVANGDLPGITNPYGYTTPVQLIGTDYLYGTQSDEGRAMLQIVHDVAPSATLAFATGFVSAGNMAQKIRQLQAAGCNIGVDDITYITEPYFHDGMIATAINDVTALGMTYFTAAGNYGEKSYEGIYNPVDASDLIPIGTAHNFHSADSVDRFQNITVGPGSYLLVLQWEDDFYSVDLASAGTQNDLDIYLTYNNGRTLFGFNRNNIGGDPIEVVPFTVTMPTTTNVLVTRESGNSPNVHFKYILFKTPPPPSPPALPNNFIINEYNTGNSTIVGQANSLGAITCGAIRYSNTPDFPANDLTLTKASFSSIGGTLIHNNPVPRQKPDIVAPNGGNTTVELGGPNEDPPLYIPPAHDDQPNFYGTSAAAPHAAAVGALLLDAKHRFFNSTFTPAEVRNLLTSTAVDMYSPGFDYLSGYGLVNAYAAMRTFAAPVPVLVSLDDVPSGYSLGDTLPAFTLTVSANFITTQSKIVFRDDTLPTTYIDEHHLSAPIPSFFGNPPVHICTPGIAAPDFLDGGCSNVLYFFQGVKLDVVITADDLTKKYGEKLPVEGNPCPVGSTCFSATVTVDGQSPESLGLTLEDLGLGTIHYSLPAGTTSMSSTGIYFISPSADVSDPGLQELYNYSFNNGHLTIQKMPLTIVPQNKTVTFGDKIDGTTIDFNYTYDDTNILPGERAAFLQSLKDLYEPSIVKEVALIDDRDAFNSSSLSVTDLQNLALLSGSRAIANGNRAIANGNRAIANSTTADTTYVIDLPYQSLSEYNNDGSTATLYDDVLLLNGSRAVANGNRGIANSLYVADGSAVINGNRAIANGSRAVANGSRGIVNSEELDGVSNTNTAIIVYETDLDDVAVDNPDSTYQLLSINGITGLTAGDHFIIPGGFMSADFDVTYGLGQLHINPYELKVDADDKTSEYGTPPNYTSVISGYQYDDNASSVLSGSLSYTPTGQINVGNYPIGQSGLSLIQPSNYFLTTIGGTLNVTPATLTVTADDKSRPYGYNNPPLTISYSGFKYSDNESVISPAITASTTALVSSLPGAYPITLSSSGTASNYSIVRVPGTLTVEAAGRSCSINSPANLPACNTSGNTLTASADAGYNYNWTVSGTGWSITSGNGNLSITYTSGGSGTSGVFTLNVTAPISGYLISSCTLTVGTICGTEYCTYGQGSWGTSGGTVCNGMTTSAVVPTLMTSVLVSGDGTRKITFGTSESSCLITKLPAGQTSAQLPVGNVSCAGATGGNYLNSGKFKSNLLGQQIALELSCRYNPALRGLRITGAYVTTYNATSCSNGYAVAGSQQTYALVPAVVSYLGANNTVNDLILLANKGLGGTLASGAPSLTDIGNTISNLLLAFNQCKILGGFSSTASRDAVLNDIPNSSTKSIFFYPNPTSDNTTVSFVAAQGSHVTLDIYDINGSLISHPLDRTMTEDGIYTLDVDCSSYAKGIYFMRLTVDDEMSQGKLVIIK